MPQWTRRCAFGLILTMAWPVMAQQAPVLNGTWIMLLEGHQVGLELEDKSGTLEATLHIMGQRVLLDGTVQDGSFSLTSDDQVGDTQSHGATVKMKITGRYQPDDTLAGEIDLPRGPMKWTAERLKKP